MLGRGVIAAVAVLVLLDALSTYLCVQYYPVELELNPLLRYLLRLYGGLGALAYAPLEFLALTSLLTFYVRKLRDLGIRRVGRFVSLVLVAVAAFVASNLAGLLVAYTHVHP